MNQIAVPPGAAERFVEETKRALLEATSNILERIAAGELDPEDATEAIEEVVIKGIDAGATLLDATIEPSGAGELLTDAVIDWGAAQLRERAAPVIADVVEAVDKAVGYNPLRAAARLARLIEEDTEDGELFDDKVRRVHRTARRIYEKSPGLAEELGIGFDGKQLLIEGQRWGRPPKGFRKPEQDPGQVGIP